MEHAVLLLWLSSLGVSFFLFCYLTIKINHWETMILLGFPSSCTPLFLKRGVWPYNFIRVPAAIWWIWYFDEVVFLFGGAILLFVAWCICSKRGEKAGFKEYRQIILELIEFAETNEERVKLSEFINISDDELKSMKEQKAIMLGWLPTTLK